MPGGGTRFSLADQVVEVLHDRGSAERPDWSVGSGFVVGGRRVLTAAHNASGAGELIVRFRGTAEHPARIAPLQGGGAALSEELDIAVLEIDDDVPERPRVRFARIEEEPELGVPNLDGCWALGFPRFQEKRRDGRERPVRESARVDGFVPMGEGLVEGLPTLVATRAPRELPAGELGSSEWQGISGAVVFSGPLAVGVVTEHHRPAGAGSLTLVPVTRLDRRPDAADWWALLGVEDPAALLTLPVAVADGPLGEPWAFDSFLATRRRYFTGREWLFEEIADWIAAGPGNARLLTGAPGSGKSAIFAELAAGRCGPVLAYHCCIADTPATLDPAGFVRSIAAMVAANLPEYADRVRADPELAARLTEVSVTADPASAFETGLLDPLRALPPPLEPQLLLVDALDEAMTATGPSTIVDVLGPRLGRLPPWLRLVATSRPQADVRSHLGAALELPIGEHEADNARDLSGYISARAGSAELAAGVLDAAAGSFLVATMMLDAIELGQLSADDLSGFPPGLGSAYSAFLTRLFPDPAASYGPARGVLEAIVAAPVPLSRQELGEVTGLDDEIELPPILARLAAFVPARDRRYTPFHRSFAEWLTGFDPDTDLPQAGPYAVSVRRGHDRLATWCQGLSPPAYRVRHLVIHLAGARRYDELVTALTSWQRLAEVVEGAHGAGSSAFDLVDDFRIALDALPEAHAGRPLAAAVAAAARADAQFLARHPGLWFQSCWNRGWWPDAPAAAGAFAGDGSAAATGLAQLLERWRTEKPAGPWLRARWPYPDAGLPVLTVIAGVDEEPSCLALAPDRLLLVAGGETAIRTWDPLTGAALAAHTVEDDYPTALAFVSATTVVASTGNGRLLALEIPNLECRRETAMPGGGSVVVAALPGGRVAAASDEGAVGVWDPASGDWVETARPGGTISALAASPDGRELLIGTNEFESTVRRLAVGRLDQAPLFEQASSSWITDASYSADGATIAWGEYDGALVVQRAGHPEVRVPTPAEANPGALMFAEDDATVLLGAGDAMGTADILVVEASSGSIRSQIPAHREVVQALVTDADERHLVSAGQEEVRVWNLGRLLSGTGRVPRALSPDTARFLPDGRLLLAADDREVLTVVDLEAMEVVHELHGHGDGVKSLAVAGDGRVACGCGDGQVLLWDPSDWSSSVAARHPGEAQVALSRDGRVLASGGEDGDVRVADLRAGTEATLSVGDYITGLGISPDGDRLAAATFGSMGVWSLPERAPAASGIDGISYGTAFTADGRHLVFVVPGGAISVADAETGAPVPTTPEHEAAWLAALGCSDPRWFWRSPRGHGGSPASAPEMPLVELATGAAVAWFPLVWAEAIPDPTGRTWALLTKRELFVVGLELA